MTEQPFCPDLEVVSRVLGGNREAYAWIVNRYKVPLFRLGVKLTGDFSLVDDIVQETFIKAYQKLESFEGRSTFKSWLYQIFMNTLRNFMRKKNHLNVEKCNLTHHEPMVEKLHHQQVALILEEAIRKLPPRQKIAVTLRIYEDLSFEEIAQIMGSPYDTAKANFRHGLLKLKASLEHIKNTLELSEETHPVIQEISYPLEEAETF